MTLKLDSFSKNKDKGPKAPVKVAFKATRGTKFIIFLGDDGVILVQMRNNVIINRHFITDASEANLKEFSRYFAGNPKAIVYLVIDSMDQQFVQQTMPPVSAMSVQKLIKRRLDRDFGVNDIKGAIVLGREKTGRKDWSFMMVSLERTQQVSAWLEYIHTLPNRFAGISLLSVETEIFLKNLNASMGTPKEGTGSEWTFFVSHNKVGGFRQVILRSGKLVFTRMTQPIGESKPDVIAGNIEQEMLGTVEYMKRLGYNPGAGMDIYVITSGLVRDALDMSRFGARVAHVMTPYEVSQYLGITGGTQPNDQFGDVILAAAIGSARKHNLTLQPDQFRQAYNVYQAIRFQRVAAALAALGMIGYMGTLGYEIFLQYEKSEDLSRSLTRTKREYDDLIAEIKAYNPNLEKANDTIDLYKQMLDEKVSPVVFLSNLTSIVKPPVYIKAVDWSIEGANVARRKGGKAADAGATPGSSPAPTSDKKLTFSKEKMVATVALEFYDVLDQPGLFKKLSQKTLDDFKQALPGFSIGYAALPKTVGENEKVQLNFSSKEAEAKAEAANQDANKPLEVSIVISGFVPVNPPDVEAAKAKAKIAQEEKKAKAKPAAGAPAAEPAVPAVPAAPAKEAPAMKLRVVQKRWGIESLIAVAVLGALYGGIYLLEGTRDDFNKEVADLEGKLSKVTAEKNTLNTQYQNVKNNEGIYTEAQARNPANGKFTNRQIAARKFNSFNARYNLSNLRLSMSTANEQTDAKYRRKTTLVAASNVTIEFDTVTDDKVNLFMDAMQNELLGMPKIVALTLTRSEKLTDKALKSLVERGSYPLVKANMQVQWLGLIPSEATLPAGDNAAPAQ